MPATRLLIALLACVLALPLHAANGPTASPGCAAWAPGVQRCEVGVSAGVLAAIGQQQLASNWCWAAAASMVLSRYGVAARQDEIVRGWFGSAVNLGAGVDALQATLNRRWNGADGQPLQVLVVDQLGAGLDTLPVDVLADLRQGRPLLLAAWRHAMLLVNVVYEQDLGGGAARLLSAMVLDPALPGGPRLLRANELRPNYLARVVVVAAPSMP